jgi:hypothetical protein
MEITAANSKTVLTSSLTNELFRMFGGLAPEKIEWAFRTHRDTSDFWPSIRQLNALVDEFEDRKRREEKAELSVWTESGLKQWHTILKAACERMHLVPKAYYRAESAVKNSRETLKQQAERLSK